MDDPLNWPRLLAQLRRRGWRALLMMGVLLFGGVVVAFAMDSPYTATAYLAVARPDPAVRVRPPAAEETTVNAASDTGLTRLAQSRAYAELIGTPGVAALVRRDLGDRVPASWGAEDLLRRVRTRALAEGALIQIEAHAASPAQAAGVANTWAATFSGHIESLFGNDGDLAAAERLEVAAAHDLATAEAQPAASESSTARRARDLATERYLALARRAAELTLTEAISRAEVRVASAAEAPRGRDWARLARWPLLGLLAGLFLGLLWALAPWAAGDAPAAARPS